MQSCYICSTNFTSLLLCTFSWGDTNDPNDAKALCVTNPNDLKNKLEDSDDNSITLTNGVQSFNADFSRCATGLNPLASVVREHFTYAISVCTDYTDDATITTLLQNITMQVRHKIPEDNTIQISLLVKQRASDYAAYAEDPGQCNTGTVLVLEIRKDTTCSYTALLPFMDTSFLSKSSCERNGITNINFSIISYFILSG